MFRINSYYKQHAHWYNDEPSIRWMLTERAERFAKDMSVYGSSCGDLVL